MFWRTFAVFVAIVVVSIALLIVILYMGVTVSERRSDHGEERLPASTPQSTTSESEGTTTEFSERVSPIGGRAAFDSMMNTVLVVNRMCSHELALSTPACQDYVRYIIQEIEEIAEAQPSPKAVRRLHRRVIETGIDVSDCKGSYPDLETCRFLAKMEKNL